MKSTLLLIVVMLAVTLPSAHSAGADISNYEAFGTGLACINGLASIPGHILAFLYGAAIVVYMMAFGGVTFFPQLLLFTLGGVTTFSIDFAISQLPHCNTFFNYIMAVSQIQ